MFAAEFTTCNIELGGSSNSEVLTSLRSEKGKAEAQC